MYHGAQTGRLTVGFGGASYSADAELATSLRQLRATSRQLVRDSAYAKRAKTIVVNNIIGAGIGMQAQVMTTRTTLNRNVNDDIEQAWELWARADSCHTGGALHFADFERACMSQVFEAGEVFIRKHYRRFGDSAVPFALELIEAERVADELNPLARGPLEAGNTIRMGIEVDRFGRAIAYWLRQFHQGESRFGTPGIEGAAERVPADQIIHLRLADRWPMTRGEPWMHAVIRKINDLDGYTEAELVAARGAACYMATIETPDLESPVGDELPDGTQEVVLEPGTTQRIRTGEKFNFHAPNRPNPALDAFMRSMLRELAAGAACSYESLSRDYSQSNYSSSRLALLDDRDLWRMAQAWFIRSLRQAVHEQWLRQAVLARAIASISVEAYAANPIKFAAVRFKPRGWSWIDPTSEVDAYVKAVRNGFTTVADVIAQTGNGTDIEDVLVGRERELQMMHDKKLIFDTDPERNSKGDPLASAAPPPAEPAPTDGAAADPARAMHDAAVAIARYPRAVGE